MKYSRGVIALISGFALPVGSTYVAGYLAAMAIPKAYFAFFGRHHEELAFALLEFFHMALPLFLLSIAWCWLTLRGMVSALRVAAWCCVTGIVLGLTYEEWMSAVSLRAAEAVPNPASLFAYLWRVLPRWWAVPNLLAFPAGLAVARMLAHRSEDSGKTALSIT